MSVKSSSSLGHVPTTQRWAFDGGVTEVFTDMLERSIPQYDVMRQTVTDLAVHFAQKASVVLDLGCSRGDALAPIMQSLGDDVRYHGVEVSQPMLGAALERFHERIITGNCVIEDLDLRHAFPEVAPSVILSVLTIQFTPIEYRQRIMQNIYDHLLPGGAFIFVEKALGASAGLNQTMTDLYYGLKSANGYSADEILRKRLSLEGVLVPVTAKWNEELLHSAGFTHVDCFWRWMNFAGWVAVK